MDDDTTPTETELVADKDTFEIIYKTNAPFIYRFMFWRTKDHMLAEDLTSNVFMKAWRMRASFRGGSAGAWLHKIASNTLVDHWRKKKDLPIDDEVLAQVADGRAPLDESFDQHLQMANMRRAVRRLPSDMRTVVTLRFVRGLPVRQVARQLGISEANVRVIQCRALRKLRDYLQ